MTWRIHLGSNAVHPVLDIFMFRRATIVRDTPEYKFSGSSLLYINVGKAALPGGFQEFWEHTLYLKNLGFAHLSFNKY